MRSASGPFARRDLVEDAPEARLRRHRPFHLDLGERRDRHARRLQAAPTLAHERHLTQEALDGVVGQVEAREPVPLLALVDAFARPQLVQLRLGHQPGMVVLVALERQAVPLDGVGDEAHGLTRRRLRERLEDRLEVMPAEVRHQAREPGIVVPAHDVERVGMDGEVFFELAPPGRAALEDERRVEQVGAVVDPLLEALTAGLGEGPLQQLAVLDQHHLPAEVVEQPGHLHEQAVRDDRVEALAVVVDHPPAVGEPVLPVLEQGLVHVAFVDLGIAHDADHPALRPIRAPALRVHVVLDEAGKAGDRHAETDRAGGEIDVAGVLGARGIRLRAAETAEVLQLVERLVAEQVLDGVEHGARMRLHGHPVLGPQHVEIERRHQRHQRGRRGLVPAHLQAVAAVDLVVGVMDHVGGEPQHLALELPQHVECGVIAWHHASAFHQRVPPGFVRTSTSKPAALSRATVSCRCARSRVSITTSSRAPFAGRSQNTRW